MTDDTFFVSFSGELTAEDHAALGPSAFTLYENGVGVTGAFWAGEDPPAPNLRHVVRVSASGADRARAMVVEALGREPDGLDVVAGRH